MQTLPWIAATAGLVVALGAFAAWAWASRHGGPRRSLPTEWPLSARPVFTTDERRVYRLLREALPHQVILAKLPLVRLCQPSNPKDVRYWYDLLGSLHVGFAVCSANGRVLAALDMDNNQGGDGKRALKIKQSVLGACRVRYLRCDSDRLPSVAELQLLVPQHVTSARAPQPTPNGSLDEARDTLSSTVATRRAQRAALWQDSTCFQDSFFALDSRLDGAGSDFINLAGTANGREPGTPGFDNDIGGVVTKTPPTRH